MHRGNDGVSYAICNGAVLRSLDRVGIILEKRMTIEQKFNSKNVVQISDRAPTPKRQLGKTALQNIPTARELVQKEHLSRIKPSPEDDLFEDIFNRMDDNTFWQIIDMIEAAGFSIYHAGDDTRSGRERYKNLDPSSEHS